MRTRNQTHNRFGVQQNLPILSASLLSILLLSLSFSSAFSASTQEIRITPTNDAYVVNDLNDPTDKAGLQNLNTGDLEFMKVWYAWNVTKSGKEKVLSLGYMKYDLSNIDAKFVESAKLQMSVKIANLTGAARPVDVFLAKNVKWDEHTLAFNNAPAFMANVNASAAVSKPDKYYTWDVTDMVKQNAGSDLTLVVALQTLYEKNEEQVVFSSKDASDKSKIPMLLIDYSGQIPAKLIGDQNSSVGTEGKSQDNMSIITYSSIAGAAGAGGFAFFMYNKQRNSNGNGHSAQTQVSVAEERSFCSNCGEQTMSGYNVCPYCGTNLRQ